MTPVETYIFKATAFCNLNCTYCYIFNLGDQSFNGRPKVMPLELVELSAQRMVEQAKKQDISRLNVAFHGGEPMLAGKSWLRTAIDCFRRTGGQDVRFFFSLQTNGVLVDESWVEFFDEMGMAISVSMDGPRHIHDRARVNFAGKGSYDAVVRGLRPLLDTEAGQRVFGGVLCVVNPDADGLEIYYHFRELGITKMDFLLPLEHNWDQPPPGHEDPAATPYADFLIPIFDRWWEKDDPNVRIRYFETILGHGLGQAVGVDSLGGHPISFAIIDTDGALEPLDSLRACGNRFTDMGLNIRQHPVSTLYEQTLFQIGLRGQDGLAESCKICPLHDICGAGYLPHRYGRGNHFKNPSVYCRDLWKLTNHILDAAVERIGPTEVAAAG